MAKINWFPGHMVKTRREITENLKLCDAVIEIRDARIVSSSANPEVDKILGQKPRVILLNKADLAEPAVTQRWIGELSDEHTVILEGNSLTGEGLNRIKPALQELLADKLKRMADKGLVNYFMRVMVVGIPNVGKSSLINRMAKGSTAKVGDRPGVTKNKQWIKTDQNIELLDTPGILWPKFEDEAVALHLAFTGAIKDEIMDIETLALRLIEHLTPHYGFRLEERYGVEVTENGLETMEAIAFKRGCILKGREPDWTRVAVMLLDEFRGGKLGRISLDWPQGLRKPLGATPEPGAGEGEGEPSLKDTGDAADSSFITAGDEAESSFLATGNEKEPSLKAAGDEADPSFKAAGDEADPSLHAADDAAEPFLNDSEDETNPAGEGC